MADSANSEQVEQPKQAAPAKAEVDIWSTDATNARERFSYWRDAVCRAVFNISIEAQPEHFSAHIASRGSGPLRFATSESSGYQIVRTRRDIDSAPADHYSIFAQVHGVSVISQCGESFPYNPNDICISDGRRPFTRRHARRRMPRVCRDPARDGRPPRTLAASQAASQARRSFPVCRSRATPHLAVDRHRTLDERRHDEPIDRESLQPPGAWQRH